MFLSIVFRVAVCLLSTALVLSATPQYSPLLMAYAERGIAPAQHWHLAAARGEQEALQRLTEYAAKHQLAHWLMRAGALGDSRAYHLLAMRSTDTEQQKHWLTIAARQGVADSQYEMSLLAESFNAQHRWLQEAATGGHQAAMVALYQWHQLRDDVDEARNWLERIAHFDGQSALVLARALWREENYRGAVDTFHRAARLGETDAQIYLHHIDTFWQTNDRAKIARSGYRVESDECTMRLQFVANNLAGIVQATEFQERFLNDQRLRDLPICIDAPHWTEKDSLTCQAEPRLDCNLEALAALGRSADATHFVVFAEEGKANVSNGVMFLDRADTYEVFVHELAHFAGFVDEYPLSSGMAAQVCSGDRAPNLRIVADGEAPSEVDIKDWLRGSGNMSLSRARTCNNHPHQAYKPVSRMTFLEFYDHAYIPPLYLDLWRTQLQDNANLIPAALNFAQYFEARGDDAESLFWRQRVAQFYADSRNGDSDTDNKVSVGGFAEESAQSTQAAQTASQ